VDDVGVSLVDVDVGVTVVLDVVGTTLVGEAEGVSSEVDEDTELDVAGRVSVGRVSRDDDVDDGASDEDVESAVGTDTTATTEVGPEEAEEAELTTDDDDDVTAVEAGTAELERGLHEPRLALRVRLPRVDGVSAGAGAAARAAWRATATW
jgi:hypothetical protein